ncbi:MAG: hypothetical protein KIC94_16555 [Clostridiales bacterium]|nr:hypothetical protein [Clostridiales bacterium]
MMLRFLKTRRLIQEWIIPGEEERITCLTRRYLYTELSLCIAFLCIAFFAWELSFESLLMIIMGVYLVSLYYRFHYTRKKYMSLLLQFEQFLVNMRNIYQNTGMVEEALQESIWESQEEIASHMQSLFMALDLEDSEELQEYKEGIAFPYILTFYILCKTCITYGDSYTMGKSAFLSNMNHLKEEIHNEVLRRKRLNHVFSGLLFVTVFPILFIDCIRRWSIGNLPELIRYYDGGYGLLVKCILCIVTIIIFRLIQYLIEPKELVKRPHIYLDKLCNIHIIKQFLIEHIHKREDKWQKVYRNLVRISSSYTVYQFLFVKICLAVSSCIITCIVMISMIIRENSIASITSSLLYTQQEIAVAARDTNYLLIILCITLITIFSYYVPNIQLIIKVACGNRDAEDELMRLQAVLIMLTPIRRMTVETLLEWLAYGSEIFLPAILECIDCFLQDNEKALDIMYQSCDNESFRHLVKNLEVSDRIGIYPAFEEVPGDYSYNIEKRKQDNEIRTDNQGAIGKFIAFFPMVLLIGGYLIVPFILESISQFMTYVSQLQGLT